MYNEKKEFIFKTRAANRKVGIFLKWVSGYVFFLKFLKSVDYEKANCFRLERPVNTPNEDSLQLSRQVREWEDICNWFIYHGFGPLGQEPCVSALLIEGTRVTRYAWKHERQWPCLYLLHVCVPRKPRACIFCSIISSTYINELHLTLFNHHCVRKGEFISMKLNCTDMCTQVLFFMLLYKNWLFLLKWKWLVKY